MKTKFLWLIALLWAGIAGAQPSQDDPMEDEGTFFYSADSTTRYSRAEFMDLLYGGIPATWYPSGILYDKSMDSSNIHLFTGEGEAMADYGQWLGVYQALRHARPDDRTLLTLNQVMQKAARLYYNLPGDTTKVFAKEWIHLPIGVQSYTYQRFRPEAIAAKRIEVGPTQITPSGPGDIETRTTFLAAPMLSDSIFYDEVWFSVPDKSGFLYSNLGEPTLYQVDFGDGKGLVEMQPGTRRKVSYTPGAKTLTIRARYGNTWQTCRASLYVAGSSLTRYAMRGGNQEDSTHMGKILGLMNEHGYNSIWSASDMGEIQEGYYRYALGCDNTTGAFQRPVILVTGYNPFGFKDLMDQTEAWNVIGLIHRLIQRNYDVIIFRPADGADHIANNGAITRRMIQVVNDQKRAAGSYHENVVIGFSAGALAARYALASMEHDALVNNDYPSHPHTRLFIAWEGEHQGANVPLGVQHNMTYILNNFAWLHGIPSIASASQLIGSASARDFFAYHRSQTGSGNGANQACHPDRIAYLNRLKTKSHPFTEDPDNVYARYMRRVGIANGDGDANGHDMRPGHMLVDISKIRWSTWLWTVLERVKTRAVEPGVSPGTVFHVRRNGGFTVYEDKRNTNTNVKPYDYCPGSTYYFLQNYLHPANEAYRLIPLNGWYNDHHYVPDCFVPTVSALDIRNHNGDLFYNVRAKGLLGNLSTQNGQIYDNQYFGYPHLKHPTDCRSYTPYDAVFVHKGNKKHTPEDDLYELREFILEEAANDTLWLQNREVGKHLSGQWCARVDLTASHRLVAGSNVTYTAAPGLATIEPASTVRMAAQYSIEWLPGFEAKSGSVVTTTLTSTGTGCEEVWWGSAPGARPAAPAAEPAPAGQTLTLAPNPAHDQVSLSLAEMQEIRILTPTGTELFSQTLANPTNSYTLSLGSYSSGIYLVRVTTATGTVFTQKLMVQPR